MPTTLALLQQLLTFLQPSFSGGDTAQHHQQHCATFLQLIFIFTILNHVTATPKPCSSRDCSSQLCYQLWYFSRVCADFFLLQQLQAKTAPPCCLALPSETVRQCHPSPVRQVVLLAVVLFSSPAQRDSETIMPPEQCKQMHLKEQCV